MQEPIKNLIELGYFRFVDEDLIRYIKYRMVSSLLSDPSFMETFTKANYLNTCIENLSHSYLIEKSLENDSYTHDLSLSEMCDIEPVSLDTRIIYMDQNKIAEGLGYKLLNQMSDLGIFKKCGVEITSIQKIEEGGSYSLLVNDKEYKISDIFDPDAPDDAVHNFAKMLNSLLSSADSNERYYSIRPKDKTGLIILDTPIYNFLIELDINENYKPIPFN